MDKSNTNKFLKSRNNSENSMPLICSLLDLTNSVLNIQHDTDHMRVVQ